MLGGLFGRHAQVSLPGSADNTVPALNRVRTELARTPSGLAPHMMIFGLTALPGADGDSAASHSGEIPWGPLDDFSREWVNWMNDSGGSGGNGRSGDFRDEHAGGAGIALLEPGAVLAVSPERVATGHEEIRAV